MKKQPIKSKKITIPRLITIAALLCVNNALHAGFLEDFYESAGAAVNVTPAQVYQTQTLGVVTGGGFVWKTPNKNFNPFSVTPPSLKAGCGGIDFFLGAYGMANKEQFVQFLRNVGQNASGLAFKVALQAMAPELESKIQDVANYINEWNKYFGNSCAAAQSLMDSGPSEWIRNTVQKATTSANSSGRVTDYSDAVDKYKASSGSAISDAPTQRNSGGQIIDSAELNIVWSAFNSGNTDLTKNDKEMMMSLVGSVIYKSVQQDGERTVSSSTLTPKIKLQDLVGKSHDNAIQIKVWQCVETERCLDVREATVSTKPFAAIVYEKASGLRQAILERRSPNLQDLKLLSVTTSIPIYKVISFSAYNNYRFFSEELLENYSQMIAVEVATRYLEDMSRNIEKMINTSSETDVNGKKRESLEALKASLQSLRVEMHNQRADIYLQMERLGHSMNMLDHMQKNLYGNLSAQMAANMRFAR